MGWRLLGVPGIIAMLRSRARVARRNAHSAIIVVLALTSVGCASRPGPEVLVPVATAPGTKSSSIYVATNRQRGAPSQNVFTAERANTLNFARFTIAIPPNHQPGNIEWPQGAPDPRVSFATIDQAVLTNAEFRKTVALFPQSSRQGKKHNVLIFVHGYNNNFQESLYRMAQIDADAGFNGIPVLFAWPSQGDFAGYGADKEAAANSRDHLIELLTMVTSSSQVGEIMLVAHSMGCMVTAEALRELRSSRRDRVIARLGRIVLAAPDIDVDVFQSQVQAIGPLNPPLTVLVSKDDAALKLSSFLGGSGLRAGALDVENPRVRDAALKAKVRIIDISQLESPDGGLRHDRLFTLAALYPQLERRPVAERQGFGTFLFDPANAKPIQVDRSAPAN
jgi:esterase/lipase superfamily enzyme